LTCFVVDSINKTSINWNNLRSFFLCIIGVGIILINDFKDFIIGIEIEHIIPIMAWGVLWGTHIIFTDKIIKKKKYNFPLTIVAVENLIGVFLYFILGLFFKKYNWSTILESFRDIKSSILILYLGVVNNVFASLLQLYAQKEISPTSLSIIISSSMPVFGTLSAFVVLGDPFTLQVYIGILLIICGIILSQFLN
jgi:drug/metabolite transporter (DMT)-like permease